jgi:hypothetical protein
LGSENALIELQEQFVIAYITLYTLIVRIMAGRTAMSAEHIIRFLASTHTKDTLFVGMSKYHCFWPTIAYSNVSHLAISIPCLLLKIHFRSLSFCSILD